MTIKRRHLRLVQDQIKPDAVSIDTSSFEAIPDEDEFDQLLDEVSDEHFGAVETQDAKPVKLKEWKAEEFASIYVRFRPHLERHARKWLSNQSQVDEVVQDAFLYLMVSLPELDSEIGVLKFMKWKVKNLCLDIYRASGKAYVKSIDDIAEPVALNSEIGADLERAEDAAVVRLALSKLNPRHREVLLAQVYEEKSIEEIAAEQNLSENAVRQLIFRARSSFKKALLGDIDSEGMTLTNILSVAASRAAEASQKAGAKALVLLLFVVLSVATFVSPQQKQELKTQANGSTVDIAEEPAQIISPSEPEFAEPVRDRNPTRGVPQAAEGMQPLTSSTDAAETIMNANQYAPAVVFRPASLGGSIFGFEAAQGLSGEIELDPTDEFKIKNAIFFAVIDGTRFSLVAKNLQTQVLGSQRYFTGSFTDLLDENGFVYRENALSFSRFMIYFDLNADTNTAQVTLFRTA